MSDSLARARLARAAQRLAGRSRLPALVLMTDDARLSDPFAAARALPRASMIVVRSKTPTEPLARAMLKIARRRGLAILIAGDPLLAARLGADGFHLPEARAGEAMYWRARLPSMFITVSAHSLRALSRAGADAIFLSPVLPTRSHAGGAALTPVRANLIARHARLPVYALGGLDARNAQRLRGFIGIAAIGSLDPDRRQTR